jgi:hypothetical protein
MTSATSYRPGRQRPLHVFVSSGHERTRVPVRPCHLRIVAVLGKPTPDRCRSAAPSAGNPRRRTPIPSHLITPAVPRMGPISTRADHRGQHPRAAPASHRRRHHRRPVLPHEGPSAPEGGPPTSLGITARSGYFYLATSGYFHLAIDTPPAGAGGPSSCRPHGAHRSATPPTPGGTHGTGVWWHKSAARPSSRHPEWRRHGVRSPMFWLKSERLPVTEWHVAEAPGRFPHLRWACVQTRESFPARQIG